MGAPFSSLGPSRSAFGKGVEGLWTEAALCLRSHPLARFVVLS